ncbi:DUF2828 family protein [Spiroplasma gladiatoris]|nr:DUF2828 family protein [Spiroplasma gladiatoris]
MEGLPLYNSMGLGMFLAHQNQGVFKNVLIEFESQPKFIKLKGNFIDDFNILKTHDAIGTTNIDLVFKKIILSMKNNNNFSDNPKYILIISDMEFNQATSNNQDSNFEHWKNEFKSYNLELPKIIFWNVDFDIDQSFPVVKNEKNVVLISGFSTHILKDLFNIES